MARYSTTDIKIEGTRKREFRNMLNTIAHEKIENIEGLIPFEDGKYVSRLKSTLQGGKIIKYRSGDLWVARFRYRTKKLKEDGYRSRLMYISYDELVSFERKLKINEALGKETKIISHYPISKPRRRPRLKKPFEVKVGDILYTYDFPYIALVIKTTPRTFTFKNVEFHGDKTIKYPSEHIARVKRSMHGKVAWLTKRGCEVLKTLPDHLCRSLNKHGLNFPKNSEISL